MCGCDQDSGTPDGLGQKGEQRKPLWKYLCDTYTPVVPCSAVADVPGRSQLKDECVSSHQKTFKDQHLGVQTISSGFHGEKKPSLIIKKLGV